MPDADDLDQVFRQAVTVNYAVGCHDDFANVRIVLFGDLASTFREILKPVSLLHQAISEAFRTLGTVGGDGANQIV